MFKKLLSLAFIFTLGVNVLFANGRYTKEQMESFAKIIYKQHFNGDAVVGKRLDNVKVDYKPVYNAPVINTDNTIISFTYRQTGGVSFYDLQSNGSTMQIWQDPSNPDAIHVVMMTSASTTFTPRITKYFYSSDRGNTFSFIADVPPTQNGFCVISGTSDGNALIMNHAAEGGSVVRAQAYADAAPGLGSFTRLDPGLVQTTLGAIWPRMVPTQTVMLTNKYAFVASINGQDFTYRNNGTSLSASTFTGYIQIPDGDQAETYSLARGADGRIGLAYIGSTIDQGDVFFMESTDNGSTYSSPIKVFNRNEADTQSAGGLRGICLTYQNNSPKLVFEVVAQTPSGSYFPGLPNQIMFWSSSLPGADPNRCLQIIQSDTNTTIGPNGVPYAPNVGVNDVFAPVCRPVIGTSANNTVMYVACMVATSNTGGAVDTTSFRDIYMTFATTGNSLNEWRKPFRVNTTSPIRDWTYPSISPKNDQTASTYFVNMTAQVDSIPGSFVNGMGNGPSNARLNYIRVSIDASKVNVNNLSTEVPNNFMLAQNFPNPFNPSTSIRFALPKSSSVMLNVYDVSGKLVATLINNEVVSAGLNEVQFNASSLPSGIYFYTLSADNFKDTKKMILVK